MIAADPMLDSFRGLSDEAFLMKAYLSLLGRSPDASGAAAYLARLRAGVSRPQVWSEIASGEEARSYASRQKESGVTGGGGKHVIRSVNDLLLLDGADFVRQAYRTILGRDADPTGLRDYSTRLASGVSKQQILADMRCDPEGQSHASQLAGLDQLVKEVQGLTSQEAPESLSDLLTLHGEPFVHAAYLRLFKRRADPQGLATYLGLLRSGLSTLYVLKILREAPEAKEKGGDIPGLKAALQAYEKAQRPSWSGWYYREVMCTPSDLPRDRQLRSMIYRLTETRG